MEKIFIARHFSFKNEFHAQRIFEEDVFTSYERAYAFIQKLIDEYNYRERPDGNLALFMIIVHMVDNHEPQKVKIEIYLDNHGKMLGKKDHLENYQFPEEFLPTFPTKFKIGDFVRVKAFPYRMESPVTQGLLGVVALPPKPPDPNLEGSGDLQYVVYHITHDGYLNHIHVYESVLDRYDDEIPEELSFIKILSDDFTGKRRVKKEIANDLNWGLVYVKNTRIFTEDDRE